MWLRILMAIGILRLFCANSEAFEGMERLAVGPFFSPTTDADLEKVAADFPDFLSVELSRRGFQLVERAKFSAAWNELQLTVHGFAARDAMLRLGNVLACDSFISGQFVSRGTNVELCVTLINTHDGIVSDLQVLSVNTANPETCASGVATFLEEARTRRTPRQFIALGRFVDMSISSFHENWSDRLRLAIEKHFHSAGYGVVDHEAVSPIFEEFELEQAGFIGAATNRVEFKPTFWIVDGGCKWVRDAEDKLSVAVRIRKPGQGEKVLQFRDKPGGQLEEQIFSGIQKELESTNQIALNELARSQLASHSQELHKYEMKTAPLTPARFSTNRNSALDYYVSDQQNKEAAIKEAQRVLLLDPGNLMAKRTLGVLYFLKIDEPELRARGIQILEELTQSTNSVIANLAEMQLTATNTSVVTKDGNWVNVPPARAARNGTNWFHSRFMGEVSPPESVAKDTTSFEMPQFSKVDTIQRRPIPRTPFGNSGRALWADGLLIINGTEIRIYPQPDAAPEKITLQISPSYPASAIAVDKDSWWVGTSGNGLYHLRKNGELIRHYTEADGLLMPSVTAVCRTGNKLWIGFGHNLTGGLGYVDIESGNFIGIPADVDLSPSQQREPTAPSIRPVLDLKTADNKSVWVCMFGSIQQYDSTARLTNAMPVATDIVVANTNFLATADFMSTSHTNRTLHIYNPSSREWKELFVSMAGDDQINTMCADGPYIWLGCQKTIKVIEATSGAVLANYKFTGLQQIRDIVVNGDDIWFTGIEQGEFTIYHFARLPFRNAEADGKNENASAREKSEFYYNLAMLNVPRRELDDGFAAKDAFERALKFNPQNLKAKLMFGQFLMQSRLDPERAKSLFEQVASCRNDEFVNSARGELQAYHHYFDEMNNTSADTELFQFKGILQLPQPRDVFRHGRGVTAISTSPDGLLVATRELFCIRPYEWAGTEAILRQPVTAITGDNESYWLGTLQGGLVRLSRTDRTVMRTYDAKDELLSPSISALVEWKGRLYIGFGTFSGTTDGGMGQLDVATGKFTSLTAINSVKTPGIHPGEIPDTAVHAIKSGDAKLWWVASVNALHSFDAESQAWHLELPFGPLSVSATSNYVAAADPAGGVMIYETTRRQWRKLTLSEDFSDNLVTALRFELPESGLLWLGGEHGLLMVDVRSLKVLAKYLLAGPQRTVRWIQPSEKGALFLTDYDLDSTYRGTEPGACKTRSALYEIAKPDEAIPISNGH